MFNTYRLIGSSLILFVFAGAAMAQENRASIETQREAVAPIAVGPLVTAAASAERVRFVSPGSVVQLRLEVYNEAGQKLFDTELRGGNVLDWHLQDGAGERLAGGSYACVLTTKSLSGRLSQRVGVVTVNEQKAGIEAAGTAQLSLAQQQTIGPVEGNAALTVLQPSEAEAITAVTHDGTTGQLTRTRGAFSFRLGDFFSGKDKEQMRLTEEGNLGIGTDKPAAKLDVAGDVHASGTVIASEGLEFADGSRLSASDGKLVHTDPGGEPQATLDGMGTTGRIAKWTNGPAGTLGDSVITEASGKLGLGTVNPNYPITLFGNDVGLQLISPVTGTTANDGFRFGISSVNDAFLWNTEATDMYFGTTATERMRIKANGNVGIGTINPAAKLDVVGHINTSTEYRIGGSRVLSVLGTGFPNSNVFVGFKAGEANTPSSNVAGHFNTFVGSHAGVFNTGGRNNSFLGWNAGSFNSTGIGNTIIGYNGDVGSPDLTNATAIGANSYVTQSDSLVLGSINGVNAFQVLTADTNVGIGTPAPLARLHINTSSTNSADNTARFGAPNIGPHLSHVHFGTNGDWHIRSAASTGRVILQDTGGDVGIGTMAPQSKLHVSGGAILLDNNQGLYLKDASGTQKRVLIGDVSNILRVGSGGSFGFDEIRFDLGAFGNTAMTLSPNGNVGVGTTTPAHKLQVNGTVAGVGPYVNASDLRYKRDIRTIGGALSKVLSLRGVTFDWRREQFPALNFAAGRSVGFVAQEIEQILPEAVTRDAEGFRSVAYSHLAPVLVEAVKEQQEQITGQQEQIAAQQQTVTELRRQNAALDALLKRQLRRLDVLERAAPKGKLRKRE